MDTGGLATSVVGDILVIGGHRWAAGHGRCSVDSPQSGSHMSNLDGEYSMARSFFFIKTVPCMGSCS